MSQLTDEQKAELQQLLDSLRESGATPEEIRDTISAKLKEWGIEIPEANDQQRRGPEWMSQLTDEQKAELQQLQDSLRESGATPEETREAMNAKLQEWGIELPAPPLAREPPWMSQLTDEQKAELQQLLNSLKASRASPEETRDAIDAKLQEWGIQVPAPPESSGQ
jgi:DNA-binding transcriptional MerR regulator